MANKLLVGNWKMNLLPDESFKLGAGLIPVSESLIHTEIWVAPTYTSLHSVREATAGSSIQVGAQNIHWAESGAFTGEISPPMLESLDCSFALTGHSERRHQLGESNELVVKRTLGALTTNLKIVLCIGETLEQQKEGLTSQVLIEQLDPVISELGDRNTNLVVAYEPVWAIGTGLTPTPPEISETLAFIQQHFSSATGAPCPPLLYGGSVSPDNYESIISLPEVSGALVGGASLSLEKFSKLAEISEAFCNSME